MAANAAEYYDIFPQKEGNRLAFSDRSVLRAESSVTSDKRETLPWSEMPSWMMEVLQRCIELDNLPENWDSYGALPINKGLIQEAFTLLMAIANSETPRPWIMPVSNGHIQIEWHTEDADLEIEVFSPTKFDAYYSNYITGDEWEKTLSYDFSELKKYINYL